MLSEVRASIAARRTAGDQIESTGGDVCGAHQLSKLDASQ